MKQWFPSIMSAVTLAACLVSLAALPAGARAEAKTYDQAPKMTIDPKKHYTATFDTGKGKIVCELFPADAPRTVNNFVFLAREGFYNGLSFHRVLRDFMIQGGDPNGDGSGGPGYSIDDEVNARKHQTGSLAMAKTAAPNSAGSQFYITHKATPWLDKEYTVFGQVTEGQDVVNKIEQGDRINKVTIEEK